VTLDEARTILGVPRGASHTEIRDAFRRRAREVHPDAHPAVTDAKRSEFARHFDRAREARDILLLLPDRMTVPDPAPRSAPQTGPSVRTAPPQAPPAWAPPRPGPSAQPAAGPPPPRPSSAPPFAPPLPTRPRTLRFDEFVQVVDAAGFGPGHRSTPHRDVTRIIVWTAVGAISAGVLGSVVWMALVA
jgi:hypothetical protein